MFDYLDYKNKIPLHKCVLDIPKLNPLSLEYEKFWLHVAKRKQIEGHWVEHDKLWKWIPGPIIQYTSFWTIEMTEKNSKSKGKSLGRPRLRDIEWIKGFVHAVARGFSGFKDDTKYTCHRILLDPDFEDIIDLPVNELARESILKPDGTYKEYKDALEYLYEYKTSNLGKPLYYNEAKNVVDIECRNIGKSMISGNLCGHNFLTDGVMDFDDWLENRNKPDSDPTKRKFTTQTLISAIASMYSAQVASKIKTGLEHLPGSMEIGDDYYPSPLAKLFTGSWVAGMQKGIVAEYQEKIGGKWITKGTKSGFLHRTFNDNEFAANGTRYGFGVIDEIGFMGNLLETLGQLHECTTVDGKKYGTIWMTGTGGDMDGGSTQAVMQVFYDPDSYDCLEFDDLFEGSGKKIGFFVPAYMALDEFRDEFGNVNKELALRKLYKERERAAKAATKDALNSLLQMKPLKPSEAFLVSTGNIFPIGDLKQHLSWLESQTDGDFSGQCGELVIDSGGKVSFQPDLDNKLRPCDYPVKKGKQEEGCVVIWEHPDPTAGYGYYIAGCDPYTKDKAVHSVSLGSIFIMKRAGAGVSNHDLIVAEYTGRPPRADQFFETCRRLLTFYNNGVCLYENNVGNSIKTHFELKHSLHLLSFTPTAIKANKADAVSKVYGQNMNGVVKDELEIYLRDWLTTKVDGEKMNLHYIYSKPLLKELIQYNEDGNFDRVISLMLTIAMRIQLHHIVVQKKKELKQDPFFGRKLFKRR
jgi:hypothetical protein